MQSPDERFMGLALRQARRGEGRTHPNPPVGAVVVRGARVLARGYHARAGEPHAEVMALGRAGTKARGATLYVTLEPCNHQGRTPPCTQAVLAAGIKRVVVGALDPNPVTNGKGVRRLRRAGLEVVTGVRKASCEALIEPFAMLIGHQRPFVVLKLAATLDGRIATRTGHSKWVTGPAARQEVHRLRNRLDAILVGAGTLRADDPALTCRIRGGRDPRPVVLSASLELPMNAQLLNRGSDSKGAAATVVATTRRAPAARVKELQAQGVQVVRLPSVKGQVRLDALLAWLGEQGLSSLLVEGGGQVAASFLEGRHVDRLDWFVAPKIIGDARAVPALAGRSVTRMDEALRLLDVKVKRLGEDLLLRGRLKG